MWVTVEKSVQTVVEPSANVLRVAAMFGIGVDEQHRVTLVPPTRIELNAGSVVMITGASGSGKSTILSLIGEALDREAGVEVLRMDDLSEPDDRPLVDVMSRMEGWACPDESAESLERVLPLLGMTGLNDAFVMLRKPSELSEGQRYRLKLARLMASVRGGRRKTLKVVLADEFGAALDRLTASVIAQNIRRWTRREGRVCFVAATAHDELLEALEPDVLIEKHLGAGIEVVARCDTTERTGGQGS